MYMQRTINKTHVLIIKDIITDSNYNKSVMLFKKDNLKSPIAGTILKENTSIEDCVTWGKNFLI